MARYIRKVIGGIFWSTFVRNCISKPRKLGKQTLILAFLIGVAVWALIKEGITWTMITDPLAKLEPRQEYILLFLSVLAILWLWWIWFKPKKTYFFPFKNLTHDENYDGITAGFTDILTKEYQEERYHLAMVYGQKMKYDPDEGERKKAKEEAKVQWAHVRDIDLKSKWGKIAVERLRTPK